MTAQNSEYFVNRKVGYSSFDLSLLEQRYGAKYVGQFCPKLKQTGDWADFSVPVFYQPNPAEDHTHYFGIAVNSQGIPVIFDASPLVEASFLGVVSANNEIIYSAFRHDYVVSADSSVFIDGGRDYLRTNANNVVTLKVIDDKICVISANN